MKKFLFGILDVAILETVEIKISFIDEADTAGKTKWHNESK